MNNNDKVLLHDANFMATHPEFYDATTLDDPHRPLTLEEASQMLQSLDKMFRKHRMTAIVYRNKKEAILSRIVKPLGDGGNTNNNKTHRYTTRRQLRTLNNGGGGLPAPTTPTPTTTLPQKQYQNTRVLLQELDDFIVSDDDCSRLSSYCESDNESDINVITWEGEEEDDEEVDGSEEQQLIERIVDGVVQRLAEKQHADQPTPVNNAKEMTPDEHFKSVTVNFGASKRAANAAPVLNIDFYGVNGGGDTVNVPVEKF
jgi:hypothetical protein